MDLAVLYNQNNVLNQNSKIRNIFNPSSDGSQYA